MAIIKIIYKKRIVVLVSLSFFVWGNATMIGTITPLHIDRTPTQAMFINGNTVMLTSFPVALDAKTSPYLKSLVRYP